MADDLYKDSAKTVLDTYRGQRVLFFSDSNHFATTELHGLAAAVATAGQKKGITSLGIEAIPVGHQFLLDGYRKGDITRTEFLELYNSVGHSHFDTNAKKEEFYGRILDVMDSGLRVVGLGSLTAIVSDLATEEYAQKAQEAGMKIQLDLVRYKLAHPVDSNQEPRKYVETYLSEAGDQSNLSQQQKNALKDAWMVLRDDPKNPKDADDKKYHQNPESLLDDTFTKMHQLYGDYTRYEDLIVPSVGRFDRARQGGDPQTAERIIQDLKTHSGNMVVVYGTLHTIHDNDIDGTLRKGGVSVMMVDAQQSLEICPPSAGMCEDLGRVAKYMEESAIRSGDPSRYKMPDFIEQPNTITKRNEPVLDGTKPKLSFGF